MWKVDKCLCILNIWSWKMSGLYIWRSLTANYSNLRFMGVRKIIWRWAKSKMVAEYESDIIYILRKETNNFLITGNWKEHFRLWMVIYLKFMNYFDVSKISFSGRSNHIPYMCLNTWCVFVIIMWMSSLFWLKPSTIMGTANIHYGIVKSFHRL